MGQKTNPIGARLGIIRGWESNWFGSKKDYSVKLIEDNKLEINFEHAGDKKIMDAFVERA